MTYTAACLGSNDRRPATEAEVAAAKKCKDWYVENGERFTFIGMGRSLMRVFAA
jgi:hypothetical protein